MFVMQEFQRIAFAGDWHANTQWAGKAIEYAQELDAQCILHLGDYGWDYLRWFVGSMQGLLHKAGLPLYFIDGNHENFDKLRTFPLEADGTRKVSKNVHHLPRGHRFTWDGVRFLACGGGVSVDRHRRVEGRSWWPQEQLTEEQIAVCTSRGATDVLLSHDCPAGVMIPNLIKTAQYFPAAAIAASEAHRGKVLEVAQATQPRLVMHGHYHERYTSRVDLGWGEVKVIGLDKDNSTLNDNMLVLDTAQLKDLVGLE